MPERSPRGYMPAPPGGYRSQRFRPVRWTFRLCGTSRCIGVTVPALADPELRAQVPRVGAVAGRAVVASGTLREIPRRRHDVVAAGSGLRERGDELAERHAPEIDGVAGERAVGQDGGDDRRVAVALARRSRTSIRAAAPSLR